MEETVRRTLLEKLLEKLRVARHGAEYQHASCGRTETHRGGGKWANWPKGQSYSTMSMLDGEHCALSNCRALTFLPIQCPGCHARYCEKHAPFDQHQCAVPPGVSNSKDASHESRVICQKAGCERPTLQVGGTHAVTHKAPTCERCRGLFCPMHRSAAAHACKAPRPPTEGELRAAAAEQRRARARAILSKNFG